MFCINIIRNCRMTNTTSVSHNHGRKTNICEVKSEGVTGVSYGSFEYNKYYILMKCNKNSCLDIDY